MNSGPLFRRVLRLLLPVLFTAVAGEAEVRLSPLFGDHMVLQREAPVPVWGRAESGEEVTVSIAGQSRTVRAGTDGRWRADLDPMPAGGPHELEIQGANRILLKNILIGEVWICSGQSNMQWPVKLSANPEREIAPSADPELRLFITGVSAPAEPASDLSGSWRVCGPDSVGGFSAVAYSFGRLLRRDLGVPVGLIQSAVGGTPAESWTRLEDLASDPELRKHVERRTQALENYPATRARYEEQKRAFDASNGYDPASFADDTGWERPDFGDGEWGLLPQPLAWEYSGIEELKLDGSLWCRREVEIPADWEGKDLVLRTCPIDEEDRAFFNGEPVGGLNAWTDRRAYPVPGRLVRAGRAVLAFRVTDRAGIGGIIGEPADFRLERADDPSLFLPLAGSWRYRVAGRFLPRPVEPLGPGHALLPGGLYNGMIAPIMPFRIRGAIWYQGESNARDAREYRRLFPALIRGWREAWGQGDFPFYWVQLAGYIWDRPESTTWAELRDAQTRTLSLPATGQALAIDIGEARDIHPKNKQEVGRRLALIALDQTYGRPTVYSGPVFREVRFEKDRAIVSFDHAESGLVSRDGPLRQFSIAGLDRVFVPAEAVVSNGTVVVSSPGVSDPVAVRYAWADFPEGCNLYNGEGLPAGPFQTEGAETP